MRVHLFGATSSPGCASYGFKHMASQEKEEYPSTAQFITHDFYIDDGLSSVESAEEAKNLIELRSQRSLQERKSPFAQICFKR